jgi:hypothetical protein
MDDDDIESPLCRVHTILAKHLTLQSGDYCFEAVPLYTT